MARVIEVLGPGRDAPIWDDPAFRELSICLVVRPAPTRQTEAPDEPLENRPIPAGETGHPSWLPFGLSPVGIALILTIWALPIIAPCSGPLGPGEIPVGIHASTNAPWSLPLASGQAVPLEAIPRNGAFSFDFGASLENTKLLDPDHDGELEAVVICLDTSSPRHTSGQIRVSCFSPRGDLEWRGCPFLRDFTLLGPRRVGRSGNPGSMEALMRVSVFVCRISGVAAFEEVTA